MKKLIAASFLWGCVGDVLAQPDPKAWTRLFGGASEDFADTVAADASGNAIVVGATQGALGGSNAGRYDLFVAKYDPAGNRLWIRQRGTAERDFAYDVATDAAGNIYITGYTGAGLDGNTHIGRWDAYLMKFNSVGTWQWTRQIGTANDDEGYGVAVDPSANVLLTGYVRGNLHGIPRVGAADVFICKYDPSGNRLWTVLFGSPENDQGNAITCDAAGNIYVTGGCEGSLDGTPYLGNGDAFLAKFSSTGQQLWLRRFGTVNREGGNRLATDANGNVYLAGSSTGTLFGYPRLGGHDAFLAKYDPDGNLLWGRMFGTTEHDRAWGVGLNGAGDVYVAGSTEGPLHGNTHYGLPDIFLAKFTPAGDRLWTTQIGTEGEDAAEGMAISPDGDVYLAGSSTGNLDGLPNAGGFDGFVMKFSPAPAPLRLTLQPTNGLLRLSWPATPPARLERTENLNAPVVWTPDTNSVMLMGDHKAVHVTPFGDQSFFRLVLDQQ